MERQPQGRIEDHLRLPRIWWMRSAYAIEVNPWAPKEHIEAALLFRGAIVSAHGYVETRLAELALRSSKLPEYADIRDTYPYKHGQKLSYLRSVFLSEPLKPYQDTAERFFTRFDAGADLRNLMAHAKMDVDSSWIVFEDFDIGKKGAIQRRQFPFTLKDLEKTAWKAVCLSRICQRLADELESQNILPAL